MKKLVRPKKGRKIAGVCLAIAQYLDIDVTVVRIVFLIMLLPGGAPGVFPYLIIWFVTPEE